MPVQPSHNVSERRLPASVRILATTDGAMAITRPDDRTLILRLESGMVRRLAADEGMQTTRLPGRGSGSR